MRAAAIIVAAGSGERAGAEIPKQYKMLGGIPVLVWSVRALLAAEVNPVVVVIGAGHAQLFQDAVAGEPEVVAVIGGSTRTASVRAGLAALNAARPDFVLIHDAARPGLRAQTIRDLLGALSSGAVAAAPALPVADALKRAGDARVIEDVSREGLVRVQTPQAFRFAPLAAAYGALPDNVSTTTTSRSRAPLACPCGSWRAIRA